ncbi:Autophagy-related protein 7 [Hordeum vulgare]|nr:Autophagy-related protein 7 [Hordeum vulgare]
MASSGDAGCGSVDGSYGPVDGSAGSGMILRDNKGTVIFASYRKLFHCNEALEEEVQAMKEGLDLSVVHSQTTIVLQSDCVSLGAFIQTAMAAFVECSCPILLLGLLVYGVRDGNGDGDVSVRDSSKPTMILDLSFEAACTLWGKMLCRNSLMWKEYLKLFSQEKEETLSRRESEKPMQFTAMILVGTVGHVIFEHFSSRVITEMAWCSTHKKLPQSDISQNAFGCSLLVSNGQHLYKISEQQYESEFFSSNDHQSSIHEGVD